MRTNISEQADAAAKVADLSNAVDVLTAERLELQTAVVGAVATCDAARAEATLLRDANALLQAAANDAEAAAAEALAAQRDAAAADRDALEERQGACLAARDDLVAQRDSLVEEKGVLAAEREELRQKQGDLQSRAEECLMLAEAQRRELDALRQVTAASQVSECVTHWAGGSSGWLLLSCLLKAGHPRRSLATTTGLLVWLPPRRLL